jgi:hypothetical protein
MLFAEVTESVNQANVVPRSIEKHRRSATALLNNALLVDLIFVISFFPP